MNNFFVALLVLIVLVGIIVAVSTAGGDAGDAVNKVADTCGELAKSFGRCK